MRALAYIDSSEREGSEIVCTGVRERRIEDDKRGKKGSIANRYAPVSPISCLVFSYYYSVSRCNTREKERAIHRLNRTEIIRFMNFDYIEGVK